MYLFEMDNFYVMSIYNKQENAIVSKYKANLVPIDSIDNNRY